MDVGIGRPRNLDVLPSCMAMFGRLIAIGFADGIIEVRLAASACCLVCLLQFSHDFQLKCTGTATVQLKCSVVVLKTYSLILLLYCTFVPLQVRHLFTLDRLLLVHPGFTSKLLSVQLETRQVMAVYANGSVLRWALTGMQ